MDLKKIEEELKEVGFEVVSVANFRHNLIVVTLKDTSSFLYNPHLETFTDSSQHIKSKGTHIEVTDTAGKIHHYNLDLIPIAPSR